MIRKGWEEERVSAFRLRQYPRMGGLLLNLKRNEGVIVREGENLSRADMGTSSIKPTEEKGTTAHPGKGYEKGNKGLWVCPKAGISKVEQRSSTRRNSM